MAWTDSRVFTQFMFNPMTRAVNNGTAPTTYVSMTADVINAALFGTATVPDKDAVVGSTGYNTGTWTAAGNEISDGTNWPAGGRPLVTPTYTTGTGFCMYDAVDTTNANTSTTLAAVFGTLVYDNTITAGTVAKQGACFNYFGGTQSVTAGTFTIVWHVNGVFRLTN